MSKCSYCGKELTTDSYNQTCSDCKRKLDNDLHNDVLLTPPTEEEVCELLQDFLGIGKVHYGKNSFYSGSPKGRQYIICSYYLNDDGEKAMYFNEELTPELTIEVCKFFKDEDNE